MTGCVARDHPVGADRQRLRAEVSRRAPRGGCHSGERGARGHRPPHESRWLLGSRYLHWTFQPPVCRRVEGATRRVVGAGARHPREGGSFEAQVAAHVRGILAAWLQRVGDDPRPVAGAFESEAAIARLAPEACAERVFADRFLRWAARVTPTAGHLFFGDVVVEREVIAVGAAARSLQVAVDPDAFFGNRQRLRLAGQWLDAADTVGGGFAVGEQRGAKRGRLPAEFAGFGFLALEQHDPRTTTGFGLAQQPQILRRGAGDRNDRETAAIACGQFDRLAGPLLAVPACHAEVARTPERTEIGFGMAFAFDGRIGDDARAFLLGKCLRALVPSFSRFVGFARTQQDSSGWFGQRAEAPTGVAGEHHRLLAARARRVVADKQAAAVGCDPRRHPIGVHVAIDLSLFFERRFGDGPVGVGVSGALEHELPASARARFAGGGERHLFRAAGWRGVEREHPVGPCFARLTGGGGAHQDSACIRGAKRWLRRRGNVARGDRTRAVAGDARGANHHQCRSDDQQEHQAPAAPARSSRGLNHDGARSW